jgi:sigma-B regulation protein RsbU (phosphoserine phosphatase)
VTGQLIDFESFTTLCHARFDTNLGRVSFVDCGHTRTIHYRHESRSVQFLQGLNVPLGFSEKEIYSQLTVAFDPGDIFLFYSDGLTEARNQEGEFFGEDRLAGCVCAYQELEPELLIDRIRAEVVAFSGSETFADDLTCIVVKIRPPEFQDLANWSVRIQSDLKYLEQSRAFVRNVCQTLPIDPQAVSALELAVNEAASNIIRHAYHEQPGHEIELEAETVGDSLEIRLYHEGEGFVPDPSHKPVFDGSRDGGFGLFIIEHCADVVTYARDERGRNYIGLVKKL